MAKFPKTLFVKQEKDHDTTYFVADENSCSLAEMGEKAIVGVYTLTEKREIEGVVSSRKVP